MEEKEISSGAEYAELLISVMANTEAQSTLSERTDPELFDLWCVEIETMADKTWMDYIVGKRESYKFNVEEVTDSWDRAIKNFIGKTVEDLFDKDLIGIKGVDKNGDMLYGLTEKGEDVLKESL